MQKIKGCYQAIPFTSIACWYPAKLLQYFMKQLSNEDCMHYHSAHNIILF